MIMMAITKVKAADEAEYRVVIENEHGSDEANFMLFVSGDYPMSIIKLSKKSMCAIKALDSSLLFRLFNVQLSQNK